jgi:phosphohistidine phosphatase
MKVLYLIRHAKSSWSDAGLDDFDRPLNERGKRDAPFMAQVMRSRGDMPELLLSSTAKRAKQTAAAFYEVFSGEDPDLELEGRLYLASVGDLLRIINDVEDRYDKIAIIGHNPGISQLVSYLSQEELEMPTTSVVRIDFGANSWQEVAGNTGSFRWLDYPKKHIAL